VADIRHVVVLMLENNSFDRMLGCMKAVYPNLEGPDDGHPHQIPDYPDATHLLSQVSGARPRIAVDPGHDLDDVLRQIDGGACDGFVRDFVQHSPQAIPEERYQIMEYFDLEALPVLHTLALQFTVCDHWFSSVPGPTWPNRFFVHSGTSLGHVDMPAGIFHPALHLYDQDTIYDRLEEKKVSWRIYYGDVPQSLLLTHQLLHPWSYGQMERFAADAAGPEKDFPSYAFIEPCYFGAGENDQHPPTDVRHGEALIAGVYNAIRSNEELWSSALLVVTYDEHGGFYDHVPPPKTVAPDGHTAAFAFDQLGVRVPALLVSPWIDPGVFSDVLDHTSLLKFLTNKWSLGPLGNRTARANSFEGAIARATARTDCPMAIAIPAAVPNDVNAPLNAHQVALAGFTHHLEVNETQPADTIIAAHARAMAGTPEEQSRAAIERVRQFFEARGAGAAGAGQSL
jgi:phospholipase C